MQEQIHCGGHIKAQVFRQSCRFFFNICINPHLCWCCSHIITSLVHLNNTLYALHCQSKSYRIIVFHTTMSESRPFFQHFHMIITDSQTFFYNHTLFTDIVFSLASVGFAAYPNEAQRTGLNPTGIPTFLPNSAFCATAPAAPAQMMLSIPKSVAASAMFSRTVDTLA